MLINIVDHNPHSPAQFAFSDLGIVLRDMFKEAGHQVTLKDNKAPQKGISICLGWSPQWVKEQNLDRKSTILLNAEQLFNDGAWTDNDAYKETFKHYFIAEYHEKNVPMAEGHALIPIVPTKSVAYKTPQAPKDIDVLFYGSPNERRDKIISKLKDSGINVEVVGAYGKDLAPYIVRSKIVLNVHFYKTALFPIIRFLQPIEQRVPIVCETSEMSAHNDWTNSGIKFADYDDIPNACAMLLNDDKEQRQRAISTLKFANRMDYRPQLNKLLADFMKWRHFFA